MRRRQFLAATAGAGVLPGAWLTSGSARAADGSERPTVRGAVRRAAAWRAVPAPGGVPAAQLRRISVLGPQRALAVGEENRNGPHQGQALAMLWNGTTWTKTDLSQLGRLDLLYDVAFAGAAGAWSVGLPAAGSTGSPLSHWNGATWSEADFPGRGEPDVRLESVAVGPDGRVWIGGSRRGATRLLCGSRVRAADAQGTGAEAGAAGADKAAAGAAGADGVAAAPAMRWRWLDPLPAPAAAAHLWRVVVRKPGGPGAAPYEVWVGGDQQSGGGWTGLVARWNGAWTVLPAVAGARLSVNDLHASAPDDIWAVGVNYGVGGPPGRPGGPVLSHYDGTAWTYVPAGFDVGALTGIAADARGGPAWISGWDYRDQTRSTYLHREGDAWVVVRGPAGPAAAPYLNDVASVPGTDGFFSVGMTGAAPAPPTEAYSEALDA